MLTLQLGVSTLDLFDNFFLVCRMNYLTPQEVLFGGLRDDITMIIESIV